ncbi:MAG: hypothetical protein J6S72_07120, partial [Lachnospiraceae bacterium]|nr:hypothetical protein [Lachnospiraceae bacterium]
MRDQIDDALSSILGGKKSNYTLDEIKEAEKLKKKNGGSLLDNLRASTGRRLPDTSSIIRENMDIMRMCEERGIDINMPDSHYDIQKELDELGKNLEADFGPELSEKATAPAEEPPVTVDAQAFKGVDETVGKTVFGQDEFLKKLLIAFKRPIVMPPKDKMPLNSIYVNGEENTGRHLALKTMAKELAARKVIRSGEIRVMDLSLYPTSTEEKLFLQDLYSALMSKSQIILIENYDSCHTAYLNTLSELVMTGECKLASRYILQNGQMISVSNGL